jgi:putative transposase
MSFVTTATQGRRPLFEISRVAELFIDTLLHYRIQGHYKLHAYVVMPDHVHLVITPQSITLDQAIGIIRNGFTHRLETDLPVWENAFTAYSIATISDLEVVRAYVHQLPVRANLAPAAELYPHSSAYRQAPAAAIPNPAPIQLTDTVSASSSRSSVRRKATSATSLHEVAS